MTKSSRSLDAWLFALFAGISGVAFWWTRQPRIFGDGAWLPDLLVDPASNAINGLHPGYPLFARVAGFCLPGLDALSLGWAISAGASALGCGFTFLFCRRFGLERLASCFATALVVVTPVTWFFATTIEVHATTFLCVAFAAWLTLALPWRWFWPSLVVSACALTLAFLCHQTVALLGFGWLFLVARAHRSATDRPLSRARLVGALALLALVPLATTLWLRHGDAGRHGGVARELRMILGHIDMANALPMAWHGWLRPLALLVPIAAWGACVVPRRLGADARVVLLSLTLPSILVLVLLYTVPERGGYFLGSLPFVAVLAGCAFEASRRGRVVLWTALALQMVLGQGWIRDYNTAFHFRERDAQIARVLGDGGIVLSLGILAPSASLANGSVREVSLFQQLSHAFQRQLDPATFANEGADHVQRLAHRGPLAIDLSYELEPDRRPEFFGADDASWKVALDALTRELARRSETQRFEHRSWPMLLVLPPDPPR
ncbi:MAG: hypothetical protein WD226_05140 [Planctomycetota bacterium]